MIYGAVSLMTAAGDLLLKQLIEQQDAEKFPRPMEGTNGKIWLYRNHNAGFPFGFLEKYGGVVRTVPLVVTSMMAGMLLALREQKGNVLRKLAFAVAIGGSVSNLYDRYRRRYVVDYFSLQFGPLKKVVFNLGDICVFAGTGMLFLLEAVREIRKIAGEAGENDKICVKSGKTDENPGN